MTNPLRKKPSLRAVWLGCALLGLAGALRALEPNEWQHRQTLAVERPGLVKVALPPATLDLARPALEDLRLLDAAGRETPYVLERAAPAVPPTLRAPASFQPTLTDTATQLLIATGSATPLAAVTLVTPAPAFLKAARVEISGDGQRWETVLTGAPLFRQFGAEQLRLDLGGRTASQVRITIDDTRARPVPFTSATLAFVTTVQPPVVAPLPVRIASREEFAGETLLTLDLGAKNVPLAEVEFSTAEPLFTRTVTLGVRELRGDVAGERTLATASIYRVAVDGLAPSARLKVPLDFTVPSRELLVHLANHDSPPLPIDEVRAQQRPIWLVFRAADAGAHTVLTGNPDVAAPRYDLATLATALRETPPGTLVLGAAERNAGYRRVDALANTPLLGGTLDPAPWGYRKAVRLTAGGVQQLELDLDVLARAQNGFADLRLVRDGTQIPFLLERPLLSRAAPLTPAPANDPKRPALSRWEIKLPRPGLPVSRLTLTASTALFQRHLRLFEKVADERGGSTYDRVLAEADWSKTPGNDRAAVLPLLAAPTTDTLWLETDNGDNPPLALATVQAHYPVTRLLFKTEAAPLALYYGNRQATLPRYDLSLVAPQILAADKNAATLAAEEKARSDGWAATALAGARGGVVFWGVLALVVVVLLVVVAKLLPKPATPSEKN